MGPDIYIPLAPTGGFYGDDFELRYMLRSIATLWHGELPAITLLGAKPAWIRGVSHHRADSLRDARTKAAEIAGPGRFLWWYDDCFLLKRSSSAQFELPRQAGSLVARHKALSAGGGWAKELLSISLALADVGRSQLDFSTPHAPFRCSGSEMARALDQWKDHPTDKLPIESWILNDGRPHRDASDTESSFALKSQPPDEKKRLLVVADRNLPFLRPWLETRFNKPSPWETKL